jgi:hypothetical protein
MFRDSFRIEVWSSEIHTPVPNAYSRGFIQADVASQQYLAEYVFIHPFLMAGMTHLSNLCKRQS